MRQLLSFLKLLSADIIARIGYFDKRHLTKRFLSPRATGFFNVLIVACFFINPKLTEKKKLYFVAIFT
jgi:hypothetical protein